MRDAVDIWIKFTKFLSTYLILKLLFHLQIFHTQQHFSFKNNKKYEWILLFYLKKSGKPMRIQQKVASYEKIRNWKTGLIGQANGSKVVYLSADPKAGLFKD